MSAGSVDFAAASGTGGAANMLHDNEYTMNMEELGSYPSGCCKREANSSTAVAAAIGASPGRVTVHIWSSVRSVRD